MAEAPQRDLEEVTFDSRDFRQPNNGSGLDAPVDAEMAQLMISTLEAVNLDEVTREELDVAVREEEEVEIVHKGKTYLRKEFSTRIAHILNYVPNDLYNEMVVGRTNMIKGCKNKGLDGEQTKAELMKWFIEPVWKVWRMSEPWVDTPMQLSRMLDSVKVQALFVRFFGKSIPLPKR